MVGMEHRPSRRRTLRSRSTESPFHSLQETSPSMAHRYPTRTSRVTDRSSSQAREYGRSFRPSSVTVPASLSSRQEHWATGAADLTLRHSPTMQESSTMIRQREQVIAPIQKVHHLTTAPMVSTLHGTTTQT